MDQKFIRLLMLSRNKGGISQEKMALELGVTKKTIQNWEKGVSEPSFVQMINWFNVLGIPALPYLFQYLYPDMEGIKGSDEDELIDASIDALLDHIPMEQKRQLLYLFYGDHGSNPLALMHMVTAHLQSPMEKRYHHARDIVEDYHMAVLKNQITDPTHIQPDMEMLNNALNKAKEAIIEEKENYHMNEKQSLK